jgi:hypothetical protein
MHRSLLVGAAKAARGVLVWHVEVVVSLVSPARLDGDALPVLASTQGAGI